MGEIPIVTEDAVRGKVVLIRVDHNAVKKGKIDDPYRIERSKPTIDFVIKNGGYPVLMTHIGRPRDEETGVITISDDKSVAPVGMYIEKNWKYKVRLAKPVSTADISKMPEKGLVGLDEDVDKAIEEMKAGKVQLVYLPQTRWFAGEELESGGLRDRFTAELASIADIFVNDAFGSHQPHVSTYGITEKLPSYAGFLMMEEIEKLGYLLDLPVEKRPFFAAVAGEKIGTKIGALRSLREVADNLLVGGIPGNALICAKYGVKINGIKQREIEIAKELLEQDESENKLLIPDLVIVSDVECSEESLRKEGTYREVDLTQVREGTNLEYVYDVSPNYFAKPEVVKAAKGAKTDFINAVIGLGDAGFTEGTRAFYQLLEQSQAEHNFGGGDTNKAVKILTPAFYEKLIDSENEKDTVFTAGGTILRGFAKKGVEGMEVVKALMDNVSIVPH